MSPHSIVHNRLSVPTAGNDRASSLIRVGLDPARLLVAGQPTIDAGFSSKHIVDKPTVAA